MPAQKHERAAPARAGSDPLTIEHLGRELDRQDSESVLLSQPAWRLTRLNGLRPHVARVIAERAYGRRGE
jgi:hypothetical protein